jgi:hypothetical protein
VSRLLQLHLYIASNMCDSSSSSDCSSSSGCSDGDWKQVTGSAAVVVTMMSPIMSHRASSHDGEESHWWKR